MAPFGSLKAAGQFLFLSALLHLPAPILSGYAPVGWFMLGVAMLYTAIAAGLTRGLRWLGYITFAFMLIGMCGAFISLATTPVPHWLIWSIIGVDGLVALNLFVALWRSQPTALENL